VPDQKTPTLPLNTTAFICAQCGVVSLSPDAVCEVQGRGTRADWCGSESGHAPSYCRNHKHVLRYRCDKCGQLAIHPELLCEPRRMAAGSEPEG
jgi:uncharacterized OB-fold protein